MVIEMKHSAHILLLACIAYLLNGCPVAVVGGAAAGASVVMDERTTGDLVEDQSIKSKFTHLLYENKELIDQTHVNVTSYNRRMLITGEAPTLQLKQQLDEIASQIKNVRQYYNEVIIAPPTSISSRTNDSYLTSKIKTSIFAHFQELDYAQVKIVTENSTVFLMGIVSIKQGDQITELVRKTHGVKRVIKLFEHPVPGKRI
jgi:osmotically-inducible protein OsmY